MKVAVTYENGMVYQHFGHCKSFKIYEIENGEVVSSEVVNAPGNGHTSAVNFLINNGVYALICGGIGGAAKNALMLAFIDVFGGCSGSCDDRIAEFIGKKLDYQEDPQCAGHDDLDDHGCGSCGSCGSSCGSSCGGCH